jgi:hypothetical protein
LRNFCSFRDKLRGCKADAELPQNSTIFSLQFALPKVPFSSKKNREKYARAKAEGSGRESPGEPLASEAWTAVAAAKDLVCSMLGGEAPRQRIDVAAQDGA